MDYLHDAWLKWVENQSVDVLYQINEKFITVVLRKKIFLIFGWHNRVGCYYFLSFIALHRWSIKEMTNKDYRILFVCVFNKKKGYSIVKLPFAKFI